MLQVGLRVVRGPDWSWGNEDGGEGGTGILCQIDAENKNAIVQWDNGIQTQCSIGHMQKYELRILDNAQIGIKHTQIQCDACNSDDIRGIRYKCKNCYNYDLCSFCCYEEKHDQSHTFRRYTTPDFSGTDLQPCSSTNRQGSIYIDIECDECLNNIQGIRYKCNNCFNYDLCELCYHGGAHNLSHIFQRFVSPYSIGYVLPPRSNSGTLYDYYMCNECSNVMHERRYECNDCYHYDLCEDCYQGGIHNLNHRFKRINSPSSRAGTTLPPRSCSETDGRQVNVHRGIRCDYCNSIDIRGIRYKCSKCLDYDLCDFCYHAGKHDLTHPFIKMELPNSMDALPPRSNSRRHHRQDTIHRGVQCDECNSLDICGKRYKCNCCLNYDLCEMCYNGGKHDLSHCFTRIESPGSTRINLLPRLTVKRDKNQDTVHTGTFCDKCTSESIYGMRYKCNDCHNYDLCYLCYHGGRHNINHTFRRYDKLDSMGIDLPPRAFSRRCKLKGIFRGAEVVRGLDWDWGMQDGRPGKSGIVLDLRSWKNNENRRSAAYVKWRKGNIQLCRLGYNGYCDLQLKKPSSGIYFYPDHLPILNQTEWQTEPNQITVRTRNEEVDSIGATANYMVNQIDETLDFELLSLIDTSESNIIDNTPKSNPTTTLNTAENTPRNDSTATASDEGQEAAVKVKYLESKIQEMETSQNCAICWENKRDIVFMCGHGTCFRCSQSLTTCHMCRKTITQKIRLY